MGLESVMLILEIEEEFGIDIPNMDAEHFRTVGDIHNWLKERLATADPKECLAQKIFYKLRHVMIDDYLLAGKVIKPESRVQEFFELAILEKGWPFLSMFKELNTPSFKIANQFLGYKLSNKSLTMRGLVDALIEINDDHLAKQKIAEAEIWPRLVSIFVRQFGASPEDITADLVIAQGVEVT